MKLPARARTAFLPAFIVATFACPIYAFGQTGVSQGLAQGMTTVAPVAEKVIPAVVGITVQRPPVMRKPDALDKDPDFGELFRGSRVSSRENRARGSGVIIDAKQGLVITNEHVIRDARAVLVTLRDGRELPATVVGADAGTDLGLLKIRAENLFALPVADSDRVAVGDFVLAVGHPFQLDWTVTSGIVSALGRTMGLEGYEESIQTDAAINAGNSGGALVNLRGELIGINSSIRVTQRDGGNVGLGFAVPSNVARAVVAQLLRHGEMRRGRIGVAAEDLLPHAAAARGLSTLGAAVVKQIDPGSPAHRVGIQAGDVITAVDGRPIFSQLGLRNRVALAAVGDTVELSVIRGGSGQPSRVTLQVSPPLPVAMQGAEAAFLSS